MTERGLEQVPAASDLLMSGKSAAPGNLWNQLLESAGSTSVTHTLETGSTTFSREMLLSGVLPM